MKDTTKESLMHAREMIERARNQVWVASMALSHVARGCTETQAVAEMLDCLGVDLERVLDQTRAPGVVETSEASS